jgi:hypothetical protein
MIRGVPGTPAPTRTKRQVVPLVNPYILTGLVMCLVLLVALAGTAYLAVFFNRRAKADLEAALSPLAELIDGTINLDEAEVTGSWSGFPVFARMANASEGPGRVFQSDVLDAAGGESWQYTSNPGKNDEPRKVEFTGSGGVREEVEPAIDNGVKAFLDPGYERHRVEYLPDKGVVRLVRAMRTRRDIPVPDVLRQQLDMLTEVADRNRAWIEARHRAPGEGGGR